MNKIGQISEINFEIGEIFIPEWTLSLTKKKTCKCKSEKLFVYLIKIHMRTLFND